MSIYLINKVVNKKYIQFKHENETWLRTLDYFQQENIYLKNRIAQIAKTNINSIFLSELELYQTRFIEKDTVISMLRYDITTQNELFNAGSVLDDNNISSLILKTQNRLRTDMQNMEQEFNRIKFSFNNYLADTLQ